MYTTENYIWGSLVYFLGFLIVLPFGWKFTGFIPWERAREITRIVCFVFFLAPAKAYEDMYYLAPAWFVAAFELLRPTTDEGVWRPLSPMLLILLLALAVYFAIQFKNRGKQRAVETPAASTAAKTGAPQ